MNTYTSSTASRHIACVILALALSIDRVTCRVQGHASGIAVARLTPVHVTGVQAERPRLARGALERLHVQLARALTGSCVTCCGPVHCPASVAAARQAAIGGGRAEGEGVRFARVAIVTFNFDLAATLAAIPLARGHVGRVCAGYAVERTRWERCEM